MALINYINQWDLSLWGAYISLFGAITTVIAAVWLYFLGHRSNGESSSLNAPFHWYSWPATAAHLFFRRLFGDRGTGFRALFTVRSIGVTFGFSVLANLLCVVLILTSVPDDAPDFNLKLIRILFFSEAVFIAFNFLGDLASVSVTRHVLDRMVNSGERKYLRYLSLDLLGIALGYLITLIPSFIALIYALQTNSELNDLIHMGLLGNALIPFFLFIFATTHMALPFAIFALFAVLSITIPTATYLFFMIAINGCNLMYRSFFIERQDSIKRIMQFARWAGGWLLLLGVIFMSLSVIVKGLE